MEDLVKTKVRCIITRNLSAEKWNFVLAIVCTLIVAVTDLLRPWPLKLIIDNILLGKSLPHSLRTFEGFFSADKTWATVAVASLLIALSAIKGFSVYAQTSITSRIGYRIAHGIRIARYFRQQFTGASTFVEREREALQV